MIRIFDGGARTFETNGLGVLSNALSCVVTEKRNSEFELEMTYPIDGLHYSELALGRLIVAKPNPFGNPQAFRIYSISKPLNGIVTVNAEHISYDLIGVVVSPFTASCVSDTFDSFKLFATVPLSFNFHSDKNTTFNMVVKQPRNLRSLLGGEEGSLLDMCGSGEYTFDNFDVYLNSSRGSDRGVTIRYGKNLTDVEQAESNTNLYTHIYPYWYDAQNEVLVTLSPTKLLPTGITLTTNRVREVDCSSYLKAPEGYNETKEGRSWRPTTNELKDFALSYLETRKSDWITPDVSIKVSFCQLNQAKEYETAAILQTVNLCDWVTVQYLKLGIDIKAQCITTVYNCLTDKYDSLVLGRPTSNLSTSFDNVRGTIAEVLTKSITGVKSEFRESIDQATSLITGGLGGNVIIHGSDPNSKYPDEILIMDTDDIHTAKKVWRWNKMGLGYSSTGYDGPYGLAMTADGSIVADRITSGYLSSEVIRAGSIKTTHISADYTDAQDKKWKDELDEHYYDKSSVDLSLSNIRTEVQTNLDNLDASFAADISDLDSRLETSLRGMASRFDDSVNNLDAQFRKTLTDDYYVKTAVDASFSNLKKEFQDKLTNGYYSKSTIDITLDGIRSEFQAMLDEDYYTRSYIDLTVTGINSAFEAKLTDNYYTKSSIDQTIDGVKSEFQAKLTNDYYSKSSVDLTIDGVKSEFQAKLTDNYYTKSSIDVSLGNITSEVAKKVGNDEWSTKIRQSATDIRIAWNNINQYMQFEVSDNGPALSIYKQCLNCNKKTRVAKMDQMGMWFCNHLSEKDPLYDRDVDLGYIGIMEYADYPGVKGLTFNVKNTATFMAWSTWSWTGYGNSFSYAPIMLYATSTGIDGSNFLDDYKPDTLHLLKPVEFRKIATFKSTNFFYGETRLEGDVYIKNDSGKRIRINGKF